MSAPTSPSSCSVTTSTRWSPSPGRSRGSCGRSRAAPTRAPSSSPASRCFAMRVRPDDLARYGVPARAVLDLGESSGSLEVGELVEGQLRFPLVVRLPERLRSSPEEIGRIWVTSETGERVPLERLATVAIEEGPSTISREWGQSPHRHPVRTCAAGTWAASSAEAQQKDRRRRCRCRRRGTPRVGRAVREPRARAHAPAHRRTPGAHPDRRPALRVPLGSARLSALVFTGVPLAVTGGVLALWLRDMPFSISAAVGFIALSGVAVLGDMVLVSTFRPAQRPRPAHAGGHRRGQPPPAPRPSS